MGRNKTKNVLFLCTGNYYRSRFAEIVFNSVAGKMGLGWQSTSRALALERGVNNVGPIAPEVLAALQGLKIRADLEVGRMPIAVTADDFESADWVVALKESEHRPLLIERYPTRTEKVEFWDVDDAPDVLALVEREVMGLVARLMRGGQKREGPPPDPVVDERPAVAKAAAKKAKVGRETAGRRGKGVTTVFETGLVDEELQQLAATLKQRCGTGGTVKDGRIEIQGDQRDRVAAELQKLGYAVKRVGG
jgi:predicted translation initiation factor SUI1